MLPPKNDSGRILYRLETSIDIFNRAIPTILIQHEPTVMLNSHAKILLCASLETKSAEISLMKGAYYHFCIRANPVKSVFSNNPGKRGRIIGLKTDEERYGWIERKLAEKSMLLCSLDIVPEPITYLQKPNQTRSNRISISGVLYTGILRIENPELAIIPIIEGIGRAKSFGFGLLSIANCHRG